MFVFFLGTHCHKDYYPLNIIKCNQACAVKIFYGLVRHFKCLIIYFFDLMLVGGIYDEYKKFIFNAGLYWNLQNYQVIESKMY